MPFGPQSSEAKHPHQLFSARWFVDGQWVSSNLLVVLKKPRDAAVNFDRLSNAWY